MRAHTALAVCLCLALVGAVACSPAPARRTFALQGEVISIEPASKRVTVKHGEIKGFMAAMTMSYQVQDEKLLGGLAPGDLISATVVVSASGTYLSAIQKVGQAPAGG